MDQKISADNENHNLFLPCVTTLSEGLIKIFKPSLENCRVHLNELNSKHSTTIKQIEEENKHMLKLNQNILLQDLFRTIAACQNKLVTVKKDMKLLYDKSSKLKKQALKLQQISQNKKL